MYYNEVRNASYRTWRRFSLSCGIEYHCRSDGQLLGGILNGFSERLGSWKNISETMVSRFADRRGSQRHLVLSSQKEEGSQIASFHAASRRAQCTTEHSIAMSVLSREQYFVPTVFRIQYLYPPARLQAWFFHGKPHDPRLLPCNRPFQAFSQSFILTCIILGLSINQSLSQCLELLRMCLT
ncbi:hypothetical protein P152DRAFT_119390 [Eremomyces bilateralis CBS 781.70]|uniref:Uncharacterized protein n=1 Tax=Eremomyces bilateralis CBS 781.70 TaxID=1392243 RepID=A0A6G1GE54_9PEZI|nr:uncharacterized protein P152DRAFT_119390 [Eremomyces bilateralis CBS 781.70]KAF1816323.1 hypothetical protein P152DRAFT_119390 [Eremomyces bilateralis CBS 781.70]